MKPTDDRLMAYADGELDAAGSALVEAAMAQDPALAQAVDRHRALRRQLQDALAPALDEPAPDRLLAMLREPAAPTDNVVAFAARPEPARVRRWSLPEWGAIAAALVVGIAVSQWAFPPAAPMLQRGEDGALVAGQALSESLDRQLAGVAQETRVVIGISFRNAQGGYCRSFVAEAAQPLAGLACRRDDGRWQVPVLMEAAPAAGAELQPAASAMPPALLAELDARIAGDPLDAAQEKAARAAGWR